MDLIFSKVRDAFPLIRVARQADAVERADVEAFVHAHQQALFRFAYSIVEDADEAHDIVQEALLSALNNLDSYRGESAFRTWLFAIALNHCRKHLARRRSGERLLGVLQAVLHLKADPSERPEDAALKHEASADVLAAVRSLDERHRLPVILRYYHDLPVVEIAVLLGINEGTVHSRLFTARERLRRRLGRKLGDEDV
jgi:RNA polymerase sigma-70 factor (ECF subfamily)